MDVIKRNVENKIIVYNIIRMEEEEEEEETFWYHCGRLVKAIRLYHEDVKIREKKISEICVFLHKHCMLDGGRYSNKGTVAALRVCKRCAAPGPMARGGPSKPQNY